MKKTAVNKSVLKNGIRILSRKMDHIRSVSMGVWVNAGSRDESRNENGLSHFIEHMIFKGTEKRSAYWISKEFDRIGGQTNAFTAKESTCYYARVLDEHLPVMADILSDIFLHSVFDDREVERERAVIFQEIGMMEDNPEDLVHVLSEETYWGEHPLGRSILGTRENVLEFGSGDLKQFFWKYYQPERIVISVAGNVDHDRFLDLVGPEFESLSSGNGFPKRVEPKPHPRVLIQNRDQEQTHLCIETPGIAITDPRRYTFSLLNTILGGNMSSRLFQEVREKRGLAYNVYSFVAPFFDAGLFGVYAGVEPGNILEAIRLILAELKKIRDFGVDSDELKEAVDFSKGNMYLASESSDNQMVRLAQGEIHFNRVFSLNEVAKKLDSITPEDIKGLAEELFHPEKLAVTILGPIADKDPFKDISSLW